MNEHEIFDEEEMEDIIKSLVAKGYLEAKWDSNTGEFLYRVTEEGRENMQIYFLEGEE